MRTPSSLDTECYMHTVCFNKWLKWRMLSGHISHLLFVHISMKPSEIIIAWIPKVFWILLVTGNNYWEYTWSLHWLKCSLIQMENTFCKSMQHLIMVPQSSSYYNPWTVSRYYTSLGWGEIRHLIHTYTTFCIFFYCRVFLSI